MIRLFSAAFGSRYLLPAIGLRNSLARFAPDIPFSLFSDLEEVAAWDSAIRAELGELVSTLDEFHQAELGQRRVGFKIELFRRMREKYPSDDLCWIDVDMLVLGDIAEHLQPGSINVMAHGRRDGQTLKLGDRLEVDGSRYAIGGLYSLPPGAAVGRFHELMLMRSTWTDLTPLVKNSGDQITLNHLVARSGLPVHWFSDDRRFIYNLEIGENAHPIVGDPKLAALERVGDSIYSEGRQVIVLCWIMNKLDAHFEDRFSTFREDVRQFLLEIYEL